MLKKFRDIGIKLTPQRMIIASLLDGNKTHPSAEDLYKAALEHIPGMSFATVYNTLEIFKEKGTVRELSIDPDRKRYDPDTSVHHHLICLKCKKIVDIFSNINIDTDDSFFSDFTIVEKHIEFSGICKSCEKDGNNNVRAVLSY